MTRQSEFGQNLGNVRDIDPQYALWMSLSEMNDLLTCIDHSLKECLEYERFIVSHGELEQFTDDDAYLMEGLVGRWRELRAIVASKYEEITREYLRRRDPYEVYGTMEHEAWLMEMERRGDYQ